jgi:hypothetical protein
MRPAIKTSQRHAADTTIIGAVRTTPLHLMRRRAGRWHLGFTPVAPRGEATRRTSVQFQTFAKVPVSV